MRPRYLPTVLDREEWFTVALRKTHHSNDLLDPANSVGRRVPAAAHFDPENERVTGEGNIIEQPGEYPCARADCCNLAPYPYGLCRYCDAEEALRD